MELTLNDLTLMIEEMKKNKATKLHLDINTTSYDDSIGSIDFDLWKDEKFIKTVLTIV